ncbi:MAG: hypothetical protein QM817_26950 [Archangium sp.]
MTSASELFGRIDAKLKDHQRAFIRPMGALTLRFSGASLPHVGKAAWSALQQALVRAPVDSTRWRGMVGGKRFAAPKAIAALETVRAALEKLKKLPKSAFQLYVKDGDQDVLVPETFALSLSLLSDWQESFATEGGLLSVAVPLEKTESLVELGDQLRETLQAEVAWCGPAVWLAPHCLFNGSSNELPDNAKWLIELFGVDPQLDAPHLYASRWPFTANEVEPDVFSGFLAPSWTMWLGSKLAKKVTDFGTQRIEKRPHFTRYQLSDRAPFAMTEALYAQWRSGWAALAPVHLKNEDDSPTAKYFRGRLSGASLSSLLGDWRAAADAKANARNQAFTLLAEVRKEAEAQSAKLLPLAEAARASCEPGELCWHVLPALVEMVPAGKADAASALVWLDYGEETGAWRSIGNSQQLTLDAAALATACGDSARAFGLLREAFTVKGKLQLGVFKSRLPKDKRFKALRKLPEWKKLVG